MHKHKILSEGSPQLWSWTRSCSIENDSSEGSCPIEDEPLKLSDRCLYCNSRVGAYHIGIHTNWQQPNQGLTFRKGSCPLGMSHDSCTVGMNFPNGSYPPGMSHGSCPVGMNLPGSNCPPEMSRKGGSCLIEDEPPGGQLPNQG